jgi:hypothetical protein
VTLPKTGLVTPGIFGPLGIKVYEAALEFSHFLYIYLVYFNS